MNPNTLKIYGHPWSINTRKTLMTLAEKGHEAELVLVMVPRGEHRQPAHLARHPFGKVPSLEQAGFVLYETRAINQHLDRTLSGPSLTPADDQGRARLDQWVNVADSYFIPHVHPLLVETVFRRHLGGERNAQVIEAGRSGMVPALDEMDRRLAASAYLAGTSFSLADIHWMPYFDYLVQTAQSEFLERRAHLRAWWERVSGRSAWQRVARTGPQAYDPAVSAGIIEDLYRRG